jgi:hypothetical protein
VRWWLWLTWWADLAEAVGGRLKRARPRGDIVRSLIAELGGESTWMGDSEQAF